MPASANVPGLPALGFPFQNIFNIDGQQKFDTSSQFGAFQKPEGAQRVRCYDGVVTHFCPACSGGSLY